MKISRAQKLAGGLTAAVMAGSMLAAPVAQAIETTKFGGNVTIDYKNKKDKFVGFVSSGASLVDCENNRKVTVWKARKDAADVKIGSDQTAADGKYVVSKNNAEGKYYATVAKKVFSDEYGNLFICKSLESDTLKLS